MSTLGKRSSLEQQQHPHGAEDDDGGLTLRFGATVPDGRLMAVEVSGAVERFTAGIPKLLFPVSAKGSQYHPSRDGQRFLINTGSGASALRITVTVNWPSALMR